MPAPPDSGTVRAMLGLRLLWLACGVAAWTAPRRSSEDSLLGTHVVRDVEEDSWYLEGLRTLQGYLGDCRRRTGVFNSFDEDLTVSVVRMKYCVKETFLRSLDDAIEEKQLALSSVITVIKDNATGEVSRSNPRDDAVNEGIISSISKRFSRMLNSHSFKFTFTDSSETSREEDDDSSREVVEEGRGRRRRQQYRKAFPMMVAGYMMMSAFLVPLGFQFMAMIGGKALLLAKMAFFMSLFSGYKKLTNDLDYHHHVAPSGHDLLHHYPHSFHHRSAETPYAVPQHQATAAQQYYTLRNG